MTEEQVLKRLDIVDFRHLTKNKVIEMASMLDKMEPEVAMKALEQFPKFADTTKELLDDYKDTVDKGLQSNDDSIKSVYEAYNIILLELQELLKKEDLSFDEKKYVIEQMKDIADKIDKKDTENKKFVLALEAVAGIAVGGVAALLLTAIGGKAKLN